MLKSSRAIAASTSSLYNRLLSWGLPKLAKPLRIGRKIWIKFLVWMPTIAFLHMIGMVIAHKFTMALAWLAVFFAAKTYSEVYRLHRLLKRWGFDQHVPEEQK